MIIFYSLCLIHLAIGMNGEKVFPGKFLGYISEYGIGDSGVYQKEDRLYSSLSGEIEIKTDQLSKPIISIHNELSEYQPKINNEVYAKITKIMKNQGICEIFANKSKPIRTLQGIIKHENIKNDYKEFDIFDCFVPGDVILSKIIAVDQSSYIYLSTSEPHLGVVFAKSQLSNNIMMPVSWEEMECLETHTREKRKVAKPECIQK